MRPGRTPLELGLPPGRWELLPEKVKTREYRHIGFRDQSLILPGIENLDKMEEWFILPSGYTQTLPELNEKGILSIEKSSHRFRVR